MKEKENAENGRGFEHEFVRKKTLWLVGITAFIFLAVAGIWRIILPPSVFQTIVHAGYSGTQEQWLASLVGEEVGGHDVKTSYELACENGYHGTAADWTEAITGTAIPAQQKSLYQVARENGFNGTLVEWLTQIAQDPYSLGRSSETEEKTSYEMACEYGYSGTFIEWIVSVATESVKK